MGGLTGMLIVAHEYNVNYWVEVLLEVKLAKCNYSH